MRTRPSWSSWGQRLAERRPAHSELRGELPLIEPQLDVAVIDVHIHDRRPQGLVRPRLEALGLADRRNFQLNTGHQRRPLRTWEENIGALFESGNAMSWEVAYHTTRARSACKAHVRCRTLLRNGPHPRQNPRAHSGLSGRLRPMSDGRNVTETLRMSERPVYGVPAWRPDTIRQSQAPRLMPTGVRAGAIWGNASWKRSPRCCRIRRRPDAVNLLLMLIGILLGVIIGVLPGLGGANGVAILLPLTFAMPPTSAIIMLSCIYWGGAVRWRHHLDPIQYSRRAVVGWRRPLTATRWRRRARRTKR